MIENAWIFITTLIAVSALILVLGEHIRHRLFELVPPIVLIYLVISVLAGVTLWRSEGDIAVTQNAIIDHLLPATLFLMLCQCHVRGIWKLGPRVLGAFACATLSIMFSFVVIFALFGARLGNEGWKILAAISGGWIGGAGNMIAVKSAVELTDSPFANAFGKRFG